MFFKSKSIFGMAKNTTFSQDYDLTFVSTWMETHHTAPAAYEYHVAGHNSMKILPDGKVGTVLRIYLTRSPNMLQIRKLFVMNK